MTRPAGRSSGNADLDSRVRTAAFAFLTEQASLHGDTLPRHLLAEGFLFEGQRIPLLGPQGIFKPAILPELPLSITTAPVVEGRDPPYADEFSHEGLLTYRYRGTDPQHRDNVALRLAGERGVPLVYFFGLVPGEYLAVWPVFVVRDDPGALAFTVEVEAKDLTWDIARDGASLAAEGRRQYVTQLTRRRLHQESFRWRVLRAYRERCAVCRLRHTELLDAAHILPDGHPRGAPIVPNGLALCKLHHGAFDSHILGIRPDLVIDVRADVLREPDGPVLRHGLQGFHGQAIQVPRIVELRPSRELLAERYELFKKAG
jgi:putative restriction endonuclease